VLIGRLLEVIKVAVISGGAWPQFETQVLSNLPGDGRLNDLSLLPVCGTQFYRRNGTWQGLYSEKFNPEEKAKIIGALDQALELSGFKAGRSWGDVIEDRDSQITLSALGSRRRSTRRRNGNPDFKKREKIKTILRR